MSDQATFCIISYGNIDDTLHDMESWQSYSQLLWILLLRKENRIGYAMSST